jgi:hypothetical protein
MSEGQTEREALLEARVKELEAAAALHANNDAGAGAVEQVWRYFTAYVPPWIIAGGLAVFLAFHAWEYYNQAQIAVAETQLTKAQASLKDAEANARNTKIDGEPLQMAAVKAELAKKQQEAARAKVEADAQNAMIDNVTVRLQTLKAELANKRAQAEKTRAAADAASARFGLQTLEQRAVRAKLIVQQLTTVENRTNAAAAAAVSGGRGIYPAMLQAECENNAYAELIGCPAGYVRRAAVEQPQAATNATAVGNAGQYATIKTLNANLRSCAEPSTRCPAVATMPQGFRVKIIATAENGWFRVEARDQRGQVYNGFVSGNVLDF